MPPKKSLEEDFVQYHRDGSIWAKGKLLRGKSIGYREWFRKDGTKLRSGRFEEGKPTGAWTTYDKQGKVYKVTEIKPAAPVKKTPASRRKE